MAAGASVVVSVFAAITRPCRRATAVRLPVLYGTLNVVTRSSLSAKLLVAMASLPTTPIGKIDKKTIARQVGSVG